jgi:DNA-binding GntR family transcriptional regulator
MRSNALFKQTSNNVMDYLADPKIKAITESEAALAKTFRVSRTTIRTVLRSLEEKGILDRRRRVEQRPQRSHYFPQMEVLTSAEIVERKFMRWILNSDVQPGQPVNVTQLSREFMVSTTVVRGYLHQLRHYGLIEHRPNSTWIFRGITSAFATELCDIREIFELRSAQHIAGLPTTAPVWKALEDIRAEHIVLQSNLEKRFKDFSELDERFHRLIYDASENRFVVEFHQIISIIFHYHYQWNKKDEKERNAAAIKGHLHYIDALMTRDRGLIEQACRLHLEAARKTLLSSTGVETGGPS